MNDDGELDLVVIAADLNPISVYLNEGNGVFARHPIETDVTSFASAVAWGDFNHDGKLDLTVTEYLGFANDVTILLGDGDGRFHPGPIYTVQPEPLSVTVADFRGNGALDIAVADLLSNTGIGVLLGNGDGTFQKPVYYQCISPTFVVAADVNGDGKKDLIAAVHPSIGAGPNGVGVLLGNGDGTFQPAQTYFAGTSSYTVAVGDMNGDKLADLMVATSYSKSSVDLLLNTGTASFSPTTPLAFPAQFVGTTSAPLTTTITNSGTSILTISSMVLQGPAFTMKTNCKGSLPRGGSFSVQATFTPQAEGNATGTVTIKDSASPKPQVIELLGAGTVVKLSPPQLNFPAQKIRTESQPMVFQIVNTGSTPVTVVTITINGTNPFDFFQTDSCVGREIEPGANAPSASPSCQTNPGFGWRK